MDIKEKELILDSMTDKLVFETIKFIVLSDKYTDQLKVLLIKNFINKREKLSTKEFIEQFSNKQLEIKML